MNNPILQQLDDLRGSLALIGAHTVYGFVRSVRGLVVDISGPQELISIGNRIALEVPDGESVITEIVGFSQDHGVALSFGSLEGVRPGCRAKLHSCGGLVAPADSWRGRVINGHGSPVDQRGELGVGSHEFPLKGEAIPPQMRTRVGSALSLGVRAVDCFITCCYGQRLGIFAGSGVGKSVLLSMLAKQADVDTIVIGLIGERGREVKEFIEDHLGAEGLKRSVVVVATSDEPALMRRDAAYMTLCVAEYFRARGDRVLCLMDSVTRFAMALREIGLSTGEPPTTKGYPPSVFSELPKLLERAGPGVDGEGSMSGLFTVLVDGDDHNEPIADAIRGILDGHIVMERAIAERGRFPAINVLKSVSRMMPGCVEPEYRDALLAARRHLARYGDMEELIRLGAYRKGTDADVDEAIRLVPSLEAFLSQDASEHVTREESLQRLQDILTNSDVN